MIVDLSRPLSAGEVTFPGDPPVLVIPWYRYEVHGFASRALFFSEHSGTHVDVPLHFFVDGAGVENVPLERFCGRVRVLESHTVSLPLTLKTLESSGIKEEDVVLFTGNPCLTEDDARVLLACGIKSIGVEAASIDEPPFLLHRIFLKAGVPIYENLVNVERILGKEAFFFGFPLRIVSGTASPVRAVAVILS